MFNHSAALYDAVYSWKDYAAESQRVHALIERHKRADGNTLLDVACGTGQHLSHLREHYVAQGLDLDQALLDIARERNPGLIFHHGDMLSFDLGEQFDAIVCLFSAIAYAETAPRLRQAIQTMSRHLRPGGVLLVEPFFTPDRYYPNTVHAVFVDQPELKVARMNVSRMEDGVALMDLHYLVATPAGVERFTEPHRLGLFTRDDMEAALLAAGLEVAYDAEGLMGRGLYIGTRARA
ncbi:MAG TPA: class I SAM-dependent methyltransferase [Ktedonobacterales bacterium]